MQPRVQRLGNAVENKGNERVVVISFFMLKTIFEVFYIPR